MLGFRQRCCAGGNWTFLSSHLGSNTCLPDVVLRRSPRVAVALALEEDLLSAVRRAYHMNKYQQAVLRHVYCPFPKHQ